MQKRYMVFVIQKEYCTNIFVFLIRCVTGYTPLCEAVWQQNLSIVSKLLASGARVTQSHRLLHYCAHNRCVSIAHLLLKHGSVSNLRDDTGDTPLLIAARTAQFDFVELLLKNGKYALIDKNCSYLQAYLISKIELLNSVEIVFNTNLMSCAQSFPMLMLLNVPITVSEMKN